MMYQSHFTHIFVQALLYYKMFRLFQTLYKVRAVGRERHLIGSTTLVSLSTMCFLSRESSVWKARVLTYRITDATKDRRNV